MTLMAAQDIQQFQGLFSHMTEEERQMAIFKSRRDTVNKVADYIEQVDLNGDGQISFEELNKYYL